MIDHSQLPAVANAKLPAMYQQAQHALAECTQIDECQSWANKAEALASYAKQANDESLRKMADRIQARAIRRAGELLKQIEPQKGGDRKSDQRDCTDPLITRTQAATEAGMSERQRKTALRVATVPQDSFEHQVDSENPPTVTKLAEQGKRSIIDLKGRNPQEFNKAMHFVALFERHLKNCNAYDIVATASILDEDECARLRLAIKEIDSIHDKLISRI